MENKVDILELRIGNWVGVNIENGDGSDSIFMEYQVQAIDAFSGISVGYFPEGGGYDIEMKDVRAIPLTGEWMKKLGLEMIGGRDYYWQIGDARILISGGMYSFSYLTSIGEMKYGAHYVHELQNLIYMFTKIET